MSFCCHCCTYGELSTISAVRHRYPHIFTLHCTAHALDLALEKIGELQFFKTCIEKAKKIVQTITNSHAPHAIFKQKSALRLLKPGERTLEMLRWPNVLPECFAELC